MGCVALGLRSELEGPRGVCAGDPGALGPTLKSLPITQPGWPGLPAHPPVETWPFTLEPLDGSKVHKMYKCKLVDFIKNPFNSLFLLYLFFK